MAEKNYDYYWEQLEKLPLDEKPKAADKCLDLATSFDQINDKLYCYSSTNANGEKENYWRAYIKFAKNIRQLEHALKFCPSGLQEEARSKMQKLAA